MTWKKISGERLATQYIPETKAMDTGEEEEEIIVVPEEIPQVEPEKTPAPVQEPVKEPQRVGSWKSISQEAGGEEAPVKKEPKKVKGEIIGYRHGLAAKRDGQWMLHSPIKPLPWERGHVTAACGNGKDHEAPQKDCRCGLYAKWDEPGIASEFGNHEWITQVKAWGRVIPGSKGFRAQHMQITGLRPPKCEQCEEPATHMISANPDALSGRPTCADHMPESISGGSIKVHATPVGEVAKELSDFYGGATVRNHGEEWDDDDSMADFEKDIKGKDAYGWNSSKRWARIGQTFPK